MKYIDMLSTNSQFALWYRLVSRAESNTHTLSMHLTVCAISVSGSAPLELSELREAGVAAFALTGGQATAQDTVAATVPRLVEFANMTIREPRPFLCTFGKSGQLSEVSLKRPQADAFSAAHSQVPVDQSARQFVDLAYHGSILGLECKISTGMHAARRKEWQVVIESSWPTRARVQAASPLGGPVQFRLRWERYASHDLGFFDQEAWHAGSKSRNPFVAKVSPMSPE